MLVGQRISQIPPYGLQNYIAGILAALERICHYDRHGLFTLSVLILNFAMKPSARLVYDIVGFTMRDDFVSIEVKNFVQVVQGILHVRPFFGIGCGIEYRPLNKIPSIQSADNDLLQCLSAVELPNTV